MDDQIRDIDMLKGTQDSKAGSSMEQYFVINLLQINTVLLEETQYKE